MKMSVVIKVLNHLGVLKASKDNGGEIMAGRSTNKNTMTRNVFNYILLSIAMRSL